MRHMQTWMRGTPEEPLEGTGVFYLHREMQVSHGMPGGLECPILGAFRILPRTEHHSEDKRLEQNQN